LDDRREGQSLSHGSLARASRTGRRGVTLLELIVVLALLGLILAIAAPTFIAPPETPAASELATARRQAVIRGEPVTVSINGTRVHVTPLGTCIPEVTSRRANATWDAIGCSGFGPLTPTQGTAR
jgi:prepilin-type N-terminal cleavage/methylation domain-containing protein